jgi:hypothetical protein
MGLLVIVATSCGTDQPDTERVPEKIEFQTIEHRISPSVDTTLFGPQGTRIFIGAGAFQFEDGSPASDQIAIKLKEFYSKADILLADLSTVSGDRLLETAGMIHIDATSNGRQLVIRPNERIVVHFPKEEYGRGDMDLFYADATATDTSVSNWEVDTIDLVRTTLKLGSFGWWHPSAEDSTGYDFTPVNYVDTGYYWNPLDLYISSYPFTEQTKREVETTMNRNEYPKFDGWNNYGVECEMRITTQGLIKEPRVKTAVSRAAKTEIVEFLQNLPQLEPGKNKLGEVIERRGLLFIVGGNVIPLYRTDEEYVRSFESKYAQFETTPIRNMSDAEMNYYVFSVSKLGWINCDRFIDEEETIDLLVDAPVEPQTKLKMAFGDIDGFLNASIVNGKYVFANVPKGRRVTIVGIKNDNGQFLTAFKDMTITEQPITDLKFVETTLVDLRERLESI